MSIKNNQPRIAATITEIAEHLYTVNVELIVILDGDEHRFIRVGTRIFDTVEAAGAAKSYQLDVLADRINADGVTYSELTDHYGAWRNVPNRAVIEAKEADAEVEALEPIKPFDAFWQRINVLQADLRKVSRDNEISEEALRGSVFAKPDANGRTRYYFEEKFKANRRLSETEFNRKMYFGVRVNVPACSAGILLAHLSRNGVVIPADEASAARKLLNK